MSKQEKQILISWKIRGKSALALLKLINRQFWQSKSAPIFVYLFSAIYLGIYGYIFSFNCSDINIFSMAIANTISLMTMNTAIYLLPNAIAEFKNSVLLKRIGATPIKPWMFIVTVALYYFVIAFSSVLWMILWSLIWFGWNQIKIVHSPTSSEWKPMLDAFKNVSWSGFIVSQLYSMICSIFLGLLVVSLAKTITGVQAISMIIFNFSMFLSGQLFPIQNIDSTTVLMVFSHFSPFRYTTGLTIESWLGGNIFKLDEWPIGDNPIYPQYDVILNWFIPAVFIIITFLLSKKLFKWNNR